MGDQGVEKLVFLPIHWQTWLQAEERWRYVIRKDEVICADDNRACMHYAEEKSK